MYHVEREHNRFYNTNSLYLVLFGVIYIIYMWVYKGAFHGAINNIIREMNNCVCQFSKHYIQTQTVKVYYMIYENVKNLITVLKCKRVLFVLLFIK